MLGAMFALEISSLLGDPAHALEESGEEPIRKYDLGNAVLWIASRNCTFHPAMHGFTLRSKVLLEITVRKCCSKSPSEVTVRVQRSMYRWAQLLFTLLSLATCIDMHGFTLVYIYIYIHIYIYICMYHPSATGLGPFGWLV